MNRLQRGEVVEDHGHAAETRRRGHEDGDLAGGVVPVQHAQDPAVGEAGHRQDELHALGEALPAGGQANAGIPQADRQDAVLRLDVFLQKRPWSRFTRSGKSVGSQVEVHKKYSRVARLACSEQQ